MTADKSTSAPADTTLEDTKAKMRAALERKNAGDHPTAQGVRNTGAVHGPEIVGEPKKNFRPRKTG